MGEVLVVKAAEGTIFFKRSDKGLVQGFDVTVANPGAEIEEAGLVVSWAGQRVECRTYGLGSGETTVRVYVPDVREKVGMKFEVDLPGSVPYEVDHIPARHWTVHLIQFAHHDPGYTDLPSNVMREYCGFYDDVLRFCSETDGFPEESRFRYTIEQAWSLLYYLEHRPVEVRDEMMRRIREGRVEVNAFIGNEATELLGPEEMVRMMYPVFELKRKYGIPVVSAEHNDVPGISWGVAAAMAGAGIKWFAPALPDYFRWRGKSFHTFWDEDLIAPKGLPAAFHWEAPSGEKILFWYGRQGAAGSTDVTLEELPGYLQSLEGTDYPYDVLRYLVMGGKRDNAPPSVDFAYTCRDWNEQWAYPRLEQSLNSRFFPELEKELGPDVPVFRGEIPATDYSVAANSTAYPSSLNRVAHDWLLAAERMATVASCKTPYKYPAEAIDEAYYCALMNDEHCSGLQYPSGPGHEACVIQHCEYAYRAAALAHDVLVKAVNEMADLITREDDGYYAVVFNPLERPRTDVVTALASPLSPAARVMNYAPGEGPESGGKGALRNFPVTNRYMERMGKDLIDGGFDVIDVATGKKVEHEVYELTDPLAPSPYAAYRYALGSIQPEERFEVHFVAEDVPAMGYRLYRFVPAKQEAAKTGVVVGKDTLENKFYKVTLDSKSGVIRSIWDKELGRELLDKAAAYGGNQLVLRSSITGEVSSSGKARIEPGRSGLVSGSLVVKTTAPGYPEITQEIILYSDIKRIDIANRMLKDATSQVEAYFAFPFAVDKPRFSYEGSLSVIEPFKDQFPGSNTDYYCIQHWADVSGDEAGVTIASIDAPIMQLGDNWPLYVSQAHHAFTPPNFDHPFHGADDVNKGYIYSLVLLNNYRTNFSPTQNGNVMFRYSITSHGSDWTVSRASEFGYGVSVPLVHAAVKGKKEAGLPVVSGFCSVDKANVVLLALKRAEDGDGFIVRVMETEGRDTRARVKLPFIKIGRVNETNLVEEDGAEINAGPDYVDLDVKAWGQATVRVRE